jgi:uncharacterized protein (TIGR02145 family)
MNEESISKRISELFDLYKSGAINEEEYEKIKKQILSEQGIRNIENVKRQELENIKSSDKPIRVKKGCIISNVALLSIIFVIVIICLVFYRYETKPYTAEDFDGNVYHGIAFGNQIWMKENLRTTKYNDGTPIPLVTDDKTWNVLTSPAYCWYNNDLRANKFEYGALYNWYTVNTNKLCPLGWHAPNNNEWQTMIAFLGGESVAGGKLKEIGTTHWREPNMGATNDWSFSALPSGLRYGIFSEIGRTGFWWSSEESNGIKADYIRIEYDQIEIHLADDIKQFGFSVRCVKNSR